MGKNDAAMMKNDNVIIQKQTIIDKIVHFVFYFMVGVIPHIYRYMEVVPAESEKVFFHEPVYADLYVYAKSKAFLFCTAVLLVIFIYQIVTKKIKFIWDWTAKGTALFAGIVVASSIMSEYQDIVYWGAKDRYEGMWVWLAYLAVFTMMRYYGRDRKFVNTLTQVFVISASVMAVIATMQIFGYDLYTQGFLKWLAFPKNMASHLEDFIRVNITNLGAVGALYNSNYYGVYAGMGAILALDYTFREGKKYLAYLPMFLILYGSMIASRSEAALLGFAVAMFMWMLVRTDEVWKKKWITLAIVAFAFGVDRYISGQLVTGQDRTAQIIYYLIFAGIVFGIIGHFILRVEKIRNFVHRHSLAFAILAVFVVFAGVNGGIWLIGDTSEYKALKDISIVDNSIYIESFYKNGSPYRTFTVKFFDDYIDVYDSTNNLITPELENNKFRYVIEGVNYYFYIEKYSNGILLRSLVDFMPISFFYDGEVIKYVNAYGQLSDIEKPDYIKFYYNRGSAYSFRGYIWSGYLSTMFNNLFLGYGEDTYAIVFPQNDVVSKFNYYAQQWGMLVDKPHSMYIGIFFSFGILAIILFISCISYMLQKYFKFITINEEIVDINVVSLFILIVLVFVSGVFNDSVIPIMLNLFIFSGAWLRF